MFIPRFVVPVHIDVPSSARYGRRNRPRATDRVGEEQCQSPGFSSPTSSFSLPRLIPPEIGRRRSKSILSGNGAKTAPINGTAW
ncbi:hypothetical protein BHM03_00042269 [Ensete ventricosum]|nr:hypothetical protein BHM03_00042269 [Ensete ventricosum]